MEIYQRFFQSAAGSFFLFGPRGTGKSLWLGENCSDALIIDLLDPERFRSLTAAPERLSELVAGSPEKRTVVIDEIQRVPSLLSVVHALMERDRRLRFILTGSSARKIKRSGVDLLAGRAVLRTMHPFMAAELGRRFNIDNALEFGLVPLIVSANDPKDVLKSYATLYVREEVQTEGLVRNIGSFTRFLEAVSLSHASVLSVSSVARECEVGRKTVEGYLEILEDLLLAQRIPVFTRKAKRATSAHPKLYFFDSGIYRSLRPQGPLDRTTEMEGPALEGLVYQHLRAWNAYRGEPNKLYFWRTRSGVEVDFVLYGEDGLWAFEVKNRKRIGPSDLRGLKSFREDYPEAELALIYRGRDRLKRDGILCLPCDTFLQSLDPGSSPLLH
jgi:predicted AAA+ superfamily ATPase